MVAVLSASAAAVFPADRQVTAIRWPGGGPAPRVGEAHTPLLLAQHHPDALRVRLTCDAIEAAAPGRTLFATTRGAGGVAVSTDKDRVTVHLPAEATAPLVEAKRSHCPIVLTFSKSSWTFDAGANPRLAGQVPRAPVVSVLRTDVPIGSKDGAALLDVIVVAGPPATSPSKGQKALIAFTILAMGGSVLALGPRLPRRMRRSGGRRLWMPASVLPLVAVGMTMGLGAWWAIVGPVLYDDGWVLSTVQNSFASGQYSNYFDEFGATFPLGWLYDTLLAVIARLSPSLIALRGVSFLVLAASWYVLSHGLRMAIGRPPAAGVATMSAALLLFHVAWTNTLRPEPFVSLGSAICMVGVMSFHRRPRLAPIVVASTGAALATTLHPAGVVAWAPLVVAGWPILVWLQNRTRTVRVTLLTVALLVTSLTLLVLFADTDFATWQQNRALFVGGSAHSQSWRDELYRYSLLLQEPYGVAARRGSIFLGVGAIALYAMRQRRDSDAASAIPVQSMAVALALLLLTPSKWPWHLGGLAAFAALALAVEVERAARDSETDPGRGPLLFRRLGIAAVSAVVASTAWRGGDFWHPFALVTGFGSGAKNIVEVDLSNPVAWLVVAATLVGAAAVVARWHLVDAPSSSALCGLDWMPAIVASSLAVVTIAGFTVDAASRAPGWSLARQNVKSLTGASCGLAEHTVVEDYEAGAPWTKAPPFAEDVAVSAGALGAPESMREHAVQTPARPLARWTGSTGGGNAAIGTPWFLRPSDAKPLAGVVDVQLPARPELQLFAQTAAPGFEAVPLVLPAGAPGDWVPVRIHVPWAGGPTRIVAAGTSEAEVAVAIGTPRSAPRRNLDELLRSNRWTVLVTPQYRTYFPCIEAPTVRAGVATVPDLIIADDSHPHQPTSPFLHLRDAFDLEEWPALIDGAPPGWALRVVRVRPVEPSTVVAPVSLDADDAAALLR